MLPTLEQQVTSLKLSKELKETGYPQEGLWWWSCIYGRNWKKSVEWELRNDKGEGIKKQRKDAIVAAPNSAELGYWLPKELKGRLDETAVLNIQFAQNWLVFYNFNDNEEHINTWQLDDYLPNALAKELLWGLKTNLWKFEGEELRVI